MGELVSESGLASHPNCEGRTDPGFSAPVIGRAPWQEMGMLQGIGMVGW